MGTSLLGKTPLECPRKTVSLADSSRFYAYTQYMAPSDDPVLKFASFDDDLPPNPSAEAVAELSAQLWARRQCHRRGPE